ncbi:MAG: hypothetical protein ACOC8D_01205 [bacterium]
MTDSGHGEPGDGARRWAWAAAAAGLALVVFLPTVRFGFLNWDDPDLILENPRVTDASPLELFAEPGVAYLPLRDLAWNLTWRLAGPEPAAYHGLNVVCHAVASGLFALLAIALCAGRGAWVGGVAGLVFTVHPVHVEPVAWASGLKDPLSAALAFGAFLLYLRATRAAGGRARVVALGAGLALLWAAALAKASALVLPGLMACYALALARDRRRALALLVPFALLALALAAVALTAGRASGAVKLRGVTGGAALLGAIRVAGTYLRQLALPIGLGPRYPASGSPWPPLVFVTLYVVVLALAVSFHRRAFVAAAWVAVAAAPYLHVVPLSTPQADRYLYLAVGGWAMGLGLAAEAVSVGGRTVLRRRKAVGGLVALVIGGYAALAVRQERVWASSERLWERALAVAPGDALAHYMLGEAVWRQQPVRAARHFRRAADAHLETAADHWLAAGAAREAADREAVERHTALARRHERLAADALAYLGTVWKTSRGAPGEVYALHRQALRLSGGEPRYHYLVAQDLMELGRSREALPHLHAAARGPAWLRQQAEADITRLSDVLEADTEPGAPSQPP